MRLARVGRTVKTMTAKPAPRRTAASRLRQVDLAQHSPDAFVSKNGTGKHNVRHCLVSDDHRHRDKPPRRLLASQMGGELTTTAKKSSGIGQIPLINSANAHLEDRRKLDAGGDHVLRRARPGAVPGQPLPPPLSTERNSRPSVSRRGRAAHICTDRRPFAEALTGAGRLEDGVVDTLRSEPTDMSRLD